MMKRTDQKSVKLAKRAKLRTMTAMMMGELAEKVGSCGRSSNSLVLLFI